MSKLPNIAVDQQKFDFQLGLKVLVAKFKTYEAFASTAYVSPASAELIKDSWDKAGDVTVMEALSIPNLEARRVCFRYIGVDKIFKELGPELVDSQTIKKKTRVNKQGELEEFEDTYELYKVDGQKLTAGVQGGRTVQDFYILKMKCTSTDREYMIYIQDIWTVRRWGLSTGDTSSDRKPDAIEAVAWTIQVEVPETHIEKIIRAGDCIMVKAKDGYAKCSMRHISKKEYLEKLVAES